MGGDADGSTILTGQNELKDIAARGSFTPWALRRPSSGFRCSSGSNKSSPAQVDAVSSDGPPLPITASEDLERWDTSRLSVYRVLATFWSLLVLGANDASYGPILPSLEEYYDLSYILVSLVFLSPLVGYNIAVAFNDTIHRRLGQRGVAIITPICHLVAYVVVSLHPPFPVVVIAFISAGIGNGLADSAWNAWIGNMANANELLGFLHGAYGLGALIAPLTATAMITKADLPWYSWYYCLIGFAMFELITSAHAFWGATGAVFRASHTRTTNKNGSMLKEAVLHAPAARVTWLASGFMLCYVGFEIALGGWVVTFMLRVRHASDFASGMTATGFWLGLTLGRVVLGFVTARLGERLAVSMYLCLVMALELVFWLVPNFYVGAVAVGLIGFFVGPLCPAAMIACTKLLPKHLHVSSVGFAAAMGGSGGAIFPFAVGALAQAKGVQVLQPMVLALVMMCTLLWLAMPKIPRKAASAGG